MPVASNQRSLNTLRGFACLLLVVYHVIGSDPANGLLVADGPVRVLNDGLAYLRMPLFTFLAGMVYGLHPFAGDSRAFLAGKTRRLLVPMLFVGTAFALAQSFLPETNFGALHGAQREWLLLHLEPVGHFWFVEALFSIFVLVWALERAHILSRPGRFAVVWLLAALLDLTVHGPRWLALDGAIFLLPYFLGGLAASRFSLVPRLAHPWTRTLLIAAAALAVVQLGLPVPNPDRHSPWILLAGVSLCALCVGIRVEVAWLARIGASSYAIYLFHVFFTAASRIALAKAGLTILPLQIVAGVAFGIAAPMLVEHWAARISAARLLLLGQGFRGTRPRASPATARTAAGTLG